MLEQFAPFRIAPEQGGRVGILLGPAGKIVVSDLQQTRFLPQTRSGAAAQLQTDLIYQFMTHAGKLAGGLEGVNATGDDAHHARLADASVSAGDEDGTHGLIQCR